MFILQSINAVSHFNDAGGNLLVRMAIHDVHTSTDSRYVGIVLHFFANFIS